MAEPKPLRTHEKILSWVISILGAAGTALQNYMGMVIFLESIVSGVKASAAWIQSLAIAFGGLCSGLVNTYINIDLLDDFIRRVTGKTDFSFSKLTTAQKIRLYLGSFVFIVTGILFGCTAFAFGMASPLAVVAIAAGVFVAAIMIIQELETWFASFEDDTKKTIPQIIQQWVDSIKKNPKKLLGHLIAIGNVVALSLLFTMGLTPILMMTGMAAFPAVITSFVVAFTFGAFTEFYFYNAYLADFFEKTTTYTDEKTGEKMPGYIQQMNQTRYAPLGYFCVISNAIVNGALTFSGVLLLTETLALAGLALPAFGALMALASISAVFAGAASLIVGMKFWIRKNTVAQTASEVDVKVEKKVEASAENAPKPEVYPSPIKAVSPKSQPLHSPARFCSMM